MGIQLKYTAATVTEHVILGKPYPEKTCCEEYKSSSAYVELTKQTNDDTVNKVRAYARGKLTFNEINTGIEDANCYSYLAAAKIVDIEQENNPNLTGEMINTTYKIREACVTKSTLIQRGKRKPINMANAFTTPSPFDKNVNPILANELELNHHSLGKNPSKSARAEHRKKVYDYSRYQSEIVPEMVPILEKLITEREKSALSFSDSLTQYLNGKSGEKFIWAIKGDSGAGKTWFLLEKIKEIGEKTGQKFNIEDATISVESLKKKFSVLTDGKYTDEDMHLFIFNVFQVFRQAMISKHPTMSEVVESWLYNDESLRQRLKEAKETNATLRIEDFSGEIRRVLINALAKSYANGEARPALGSVIDSIRIGRENRESMFNIIEEAGTGCVYNFHYTNRDNVVQEDLDPKALETDLAIVNQQIQEALNAKITARDCEISGKSLADVVGLTVQEAFDKIAGVVNHT